MPEEETPEHIAKYKKLKKKAEQMIDTTDHEHRSAYLKAVDEHIRDKETKLVDYELLENPETQQKFAATMSEHYISKAKQALKVDKELDEMEKAMLMNAYVGTTKEELKRIIATRGKDLTFTAYDREHRPEFMKKISGVLRGAAGGHLEDKHIGDLVKGAEASDYVNVDYLTLQEAKNIYSLFEDQGSMSRTMLEDAVRKGAISKTALKKKKPE